VLFQQAVEDERQGTVYGLQEANRLFERVAQEAAASDPILAAQARDGASRVRQRLTGYTGPRTDCPPVGSPCDPGYSTLPSRIHPIPDTTTPPNVRLNAPAPSAPTVTPAYQTASASAPVSTRPPETPGVYSQSGFLRRAGRAVEGRRTYCLESPTGYPLMYVTAQAGLDLEPYLNRQVELWGPANYNGALRANYMTATRVQPLQ
jgi:hypothetical protein